MNKHAIPQINAQTPRAEIIRYLRERTTLEQHYTDREIAIARDASPQLVRREMREGRIWPAHKTGRTNAWTAPLSAILAWDSQTAIGLAPVPGRELWSFCVLGKEINGKTPRHLLVSLLRKVCDLEMRFTDREIAKTRRVGVRKVHSEMLTGLCSPAYKIARTKPWTAPLSAVQRYDRETTVRTGPATSRRS